MNIGGGYTDNAYIEVSYISPYSAQYHLDTPVRKNISEGKHKYNIPIHAESIKKIQLKFFNIDNSTVKINKASIKTIYLPAISFNLNNLQNEYSSDDLVNSFIELTDISIILVIIPIILFFIAFFSLISILFNYIKLFYLKIINMENGFLFIVGIVFFIIFYEYIRHISVEAYLNAAYNEYNDIIVFIQYLKYDAYIISLFIILFYLSIHLKNKFITYICLALVAFLIILFSVDTSIRVLFDTRFNLFFLNDDAGLLPDFNSLLLLFQSFIKSRTGYNLMILLVFLILFNIFILKFKKKYTFTKLQSYILIGTAVLFMCFFFIKDFVQFYFGDKVFQDVITVNLRDTYKKNYSDKFKKKFDDYNLQYNCYDGLNTRKNIIVIYIESLSSYKSIVFNGVENKLPYIDKLAKENIYIEEYYGNGVNSSIARMILLTGHNYVANKSDILLKDALYKDSIPVYFAGNGYDTILYSGGDSSFGSSNIIASKAGINQIYDSVVNNIYEKKDVKYPFYSVNDRVLYDSILSWYKMKEKDNKPFFMLVTTVTTHQPYIDPVTDTNSYDKTLEFADKAVYNFIEKLKKENYFSDGIVVITGDHRVMLPVSNKEYDVFGELAAARLPLIIIDGKTKKKIEGAYSHVDLGKSLEYLALDKVCFNNFQNNIFIDNNTNKCIIYQGTDLSLVKVKCGDQYGSVKLNGDDTSFLPELLENISDDKKKEIIDYINYLRIVK